MNFHPQRKWLFHNVPSWVSRSQYPYFITVCLKRRNSDLLIKEEVAHFLFESLMFRSEKRLLHLNLLVVMPNHVHMIVHFPEYGATISKIIGDWKSWSTKSCGIPWQKGFFEHRLRNDREWKEKDAYCRLNPVRAGLCKSPSDWLYTWPRLTSK